MDDRVIASDQERSSLRFKTMLIQLKSNDADTNVVLSTDQDEKIAYPSGYGKDLGLALLHNTVVTNLGVDFPDFFSQDPAENELEPMLQFLSQSESLRYFGIHDTKRNTRSTPVLHKAACLLLKAISDSKHVEELFWRLRAPPREFCSMLDSTTCLRKLCVSFLGSEHYSANERRWIASAFGANKTLEILALCVGRDENLTIDILNSLQQQKRSLRELILNKGLENVEEPQQCFDAVSRYLGSTDGLRRFDLAGFALDESCMDEVLSGLVHESPLVDGRAHRAVPTTTLSELGFFLHVLSKSAARRLMTFLQTETHNRSGEILHVSNLTTLRIEVGYQRRFSKRLAASLLKTALPTAGTSNSRPASRFVPTIGSTITDVNLIHAHPAFFHQLRHNAHRVNLEILRLRSMTKDACMSLSKCLSKLTSLRCLALEDYTPGNALWILRGLQQNGSICTVRAVNWNSDERRLQQAYCDRNAKLASLIGTESCCCRRIHHDNDIDNTKSVADGGDDDTKLVADDDDDGPVVDLNRRPALLTCALQVTETQSAMIIRGLLTIGQGCGSDSTCGDE